MDLAVAFASIVVAAIANDTFNLFVSVAVVLGGINRLIYLPRIRFGASAGSFPGAGPWVEDRAPVDRRASSRHRRSSAQPCISKSFLSPAPVSRGLDKKYSAKSFAHLPPAFSLFIACRYL
ncbi:hypothetical protein [Burkholderia ubonensis]|uniref:hypothetical protein n=1 Tax=Burkholderia ubonensis TaxID=101571 RepID=UPI000A4A6553|nr:hypothetical protein [Burkholderia ubonensis]